MPNIEKYWIDLYGKVALTGEPVQFENFTAEIGKYYEVSAFSPKKNQFAVVFNDISELKIKEKNLIDSKARLKLALDAANSGIWEWDFENDICQFDEKLCNIIGCKKEQFIGKFQDLIEIIHPDDVQFIKDEIENTLLADKDFTAEFRVIAEQGEIILQSYAKIVYSDQSATKKIIGIMIDVTKEKLEENIISENARKSQMIFDNIPVGVVLANARGDLKNINPAFCDLVGYSYDELLDINFAKLSHPDCLEKEYQLLKQLVDGEIEYYHLEKKYFRKDNSLVDVSVRVSSYFDKMTQELNLMAIVEDITERKQSEYALMDSQQKFSLLFQNLNEAAAIFELEFDTNENPKDAILIDANKIFVEKIGSLLSISEDQIFGDEIVSSKDIFIYHSFLNKVSDVINTEDTIQFEQGVPVFDPKAFFSVNLYRLDSKRVAVIMEDVTEKKSTMKDLLIKDHAIETSLQAIVLADLKGNINYVNQSFLDMWGYDNFDEIGGSNLYKYGDIEMIDKVFKEVFTGGGVIGEGKGIKKNGNEFSIQYSINLVKDSELRPLHMMASFIDITDKVRIEDELRVLNKDLELKVEQRTKALNDAKLRLEDQNEELHLLNEGIATESRKLIELNEKLSESESLLRQANEAKDKFFSIVAHDIKNPLQSITALFGKYLRKYIEKK
jgi:PAS domain S-box-containing protein